MNLPHSPLKVSYDLRPSKQIERRMLIDTLYCLQSPEINIRQYKYIGFGSIYFIDFVMFHKHLGINDLLSIEGDRTVKKRVKFNKPFSNIEIDFNFSTETLEKLDSAKKTILWLDYDYQLNAEIIYDLILASNRLAAGSFLFVTVDMRVPEDLIDPKELMNHYSHLAEDYFEYGWTAENFRKSKLPSTVSIILQNIIENNVKRRKGLSYNPLFNFSYSDSVPMLTIGGILASEQEKGRLSSLDLSHLSFIRTSKYDDVFKINVPKLTRKEREYLDQNMPVKPDWKLKVFELSDENIKAYSEIYRYYPPYAELAF